MGRGVCERAFVATPAAMPAYVAPAPVAISVAAEPEIEAPPPRPGGHLAFHVNVLGLAQLGPTFAVELGGRFVSGAIRFRAMNLGFLSYALVADEFRDTLLFSYGVAGELRFYSGRNGNMRGFFLGGALEYVSTSSEEEHSIIYDTQLVVPQFELGYRWVWGSFLLEVGGGLGYALVVDATSRLIDERGTYYENDAQSLPYAAGTVSIGAVF